MARQLGVVDKPVDRRDRSHVIAEKLAPPRASLDHATGMLAAAIEMHARFRGAYDYLRTTRGARLGAAWRAPRLLR